MRHDQNRISLRRLALLILLLTASCAQPSRDSADTFAQSGLPRCTLTKPIANRSFIVFFDRHSNQLTERSTMMLRELATYAQRERFYKLRIEGHSDASEIEQQDHGLAGRRAAIVRRFLVQAGIPQHVLISQDLGLSQPLVQTELGKPEPQNRFVAFRYQGKGTLEKAEERKECIEWLRKTYCETSIGKLKQLACDNALRSL